LDYTKKKLTNSVSKSITLHGSSFFRHKELPPWFHFIEKKPVSSAYKLKVLAESKTLPGHLNANTKKTSYPGTTNSKASLDYETGHREGGGGGIFCEGKNPASPLLRVILQSTPTDIARLTCLDMLFLSFFL
jgi:hypothetical protein